jgi:hypothetical protein
MANVDAAIADMKKMAEEYQKMMKASTEFQMQIGETQTVAQTAQQAVGGAKAASRPA